MDLTAMLVSAGEQTSTELRSRLARLGLIPRRPRAAPPPLPADNPNWTSLHSGFGESTFMLDSLRMSFEESRRRRKGNDSPSSYFVPQVRS